MTELDPNRTDEDPGTVVPDLGGEPDEQGGPDVPNDEVPDPNDGAGEAPAGVEP